MSLPAGSATALRHAFVTKRHPRWRSESTGVEEGASRPLLASTGERDEEILAPRDVHVLKPGEGRLERLVPSAPERERDVVVRDFGLGVPPVVPQQVVGRHPFGTKVGGMFQAEQWAFVVAVAQRPPGDLLERDGVAEPTWPSLCSVELPANSNRRSVTITAPRWATTISPGSSWARRNASRCAQRWWARRAMCDS
jgi:hypothetical protein